MPDAARAVVVSLDGVMAPMRGGYREAGCATVSLVDADGERLHSVRMGRMPQSHKATLKTMVAAEIEAVLAKRPDLMVVKVADGAKDNWMFLTRAVPAGVEPSTSTTPSSISKTPTTPPTGPTPPPPRHSSRSTAIGCGMRLMGSTASFGRWSICARSLRATSESHRCWATSMVTAIAWVTPMPRPGDCLPIGSGVVEAACKTLATERLKRSGMRWGPRVAGTPF